ncbi:SpoIIE family protein phosphatase [Brevinema andersonii]|nr:SpoIIE family protein phosphatase [Brevinema andersonii]
MIVSTGDLYYGLLMDHINKNPFPLNEKHYFSSLMPSTEEDLFIPDPDFPQKQGLKYSLSIPILLNNKKLEFIITLYFSRLDYYMFSILCALFFRDRMSYFYAGVLRNVFVSDDNFAQFLLEEIDDYAVISLDQNEKIVSWNKGAEKLFSYRSVEIIGQRFTVLFHADEQDALPKALEILEVKPDVKFFTILKDRMSVPIRVELIVKRISLLSTEIAGYTVIIKDITKEEIFKENIQQYSFINYTILENSQDGILILDEYDKIIFYNQRVRTILDNPMNLFGVQGKKIFSRQFSEEFDKAINTLKSLGTEFVDIDYIFDQKYYNIRFFRVHKNSVSDYGGVIVFFIDESIRMSTMLELEEKKEALEQINNNLYDALSSARIMQQNLIPKVLPQTPYFKTVSIYELSDDIGGDFYYVDLFDIQYKEYALCFVSDVSGHGISSSMMNVMVKEVYISFKENLQKGAPTDPVFFLEILNKKLFDLNFSESKFITCFAALIDLDEQKAKFCSAGHPLPYLIRNNQISLLRFKRSVPLGVVEILHCDSTEFSYEDGDRFIFYTDGFLDLFEPDDQKPTEAAAAFLHQYCDKDSEQILNEIKLRNYFYRKNHRLSLDDLTILMIDLYKKN